MKKTRFSEEQMVTILREADERPVPEVAKKHGVSAQTIYAWRKHFGSLEATDVKRLRQLEQENQRLKSWSPTGISSSTYSRRSPEKNGRRTRAPAAGRLRRRARPVPPPRVRLAVGRAIYAWVHVAAGRPGCGRRRTAADVGRAVSTLWLSHDPDLHGRQGHVLGTDRMYRLWHQEGLQVPRKRPRRRVAASRPRPLPPTAINHVWAYDFVFDTCADGRTLKCLTVIDEFTRECLAIDVAGGIRSGRVIEVLTQLVSVHGVPRYLRSDNGPEFVARAILRWLQTARIETAFIDPGKPWQNGADESFNGKFRDQHLSLQWFRNRLDATVSIEAWRRHYNEVRPHSSLGYLTPAAFKAKHVADVEGGRSSAMPARADRTAEERLTDPLGVILQ
jgi:putative transposase